MRPWMDRSSWDPRVCWRVDASSSANAMLLEPFDKGFRHLRIFNFKNQFIKEKNFRVYRDHNR